MKDLIFGAADNYTWDQIRPWAKSVRECGFEGDAILLVYRGDVEGITAECDELDITVLHTRADNWAKDIGHNAKGRDTQSHQLRFFHLWQYLSGASLTEGYGTNADRYRFVTTTDVRDVVFQRDPSDFLEPYLTKGTSQLLAPSEGLRYGDEAWGFDNLKQGFGPYVSGVAHDFEIFNVGTIAGRAQAIRDLSLTLYSMGEGRFIPNDQSSFNLLVNGDLLNVHRIGHDRGWACQCGTTADPQKIEEFRLHLITPEPKFDDDGYAYTSNGTKYFLLHQWDRVPSVAEKIVERYS